MCYVTWVMVRLSCTYVMRHELWGDSIVQVIWDVSYGETAMIVHVLWDISYGETELYRCSETWAIRRQHCPGVMRHEQLGDGIVYAIVMRHELWLDSIVQVLWDVSYGETALYVCYETWVMVRLRCAGVMRHELWGDCTVQVLWDINFDETTLYR